MNFTKNDVLKDILTNYDNVNKSKIESILDSYSIFDVDKYLKKQFEKLTMSQQNVFEVIVENRTISFGYDDIRIKTSYNLFKILTKGTTSGYVVADRDGYLTYHRDYTKGGQRGTIHTKSIHGIYKAALQDYLHLLELEEQKNQDKMFAENIKRLFPNHSNTVIYETTGRVECIEHNYKAIFHVARDMSLISVEFKHQKNNEKITKDNPLYNIFINLNGTILNNKINKLKEI